MHSRSVVSRRLGSAASVSRAPSARGARPGTLLISHGSRRRVAAAGAAGACAATSPFMLHAGETTITVPFSQESAAVLDKAFTELLQTFANKAKATRPQRWNSMEVQLSSFEGQHMEFFCNPNSASSVVDAKVLISVNTASINITTEARLTAVRSDLDAFLSASSKN